jgi:hypothetical protein
MLTVITLVLLLLPLSTQAVARSRSLQTYASPNVDLLSQLAGSSGKSHSSCLYATFPLSFLPPPRPHHLYSCSPPALRLETFRRYIASRMHTQSTPAAAARIIKTHPAPSSAPIFQSLSRAPPASTSIPNASHSSTAAQHVVVVGDSIDAFFHYRNRCAWLQPTRIS